MRLETSNGFVQVKGPRMVGKKFGNQGTQGTFQQSILESSPTMLHSHLQISTLSLSVALKVVE